MKTKVGPDGYAPQSHADDAANALRMVGHVQSGMRQLCFGISAFLEQEQRTPQLNARLACMHEDEARYHAQEAAWLRNQHLPYSPASDSAGTRQATPSRSASSGSRRRRRKVPPLYVSAAPVPSKE